MLARASFDALIVGSGPGGSTLAHGLSRRGLRVLVVEEGEQLRPDPARSEPSIFMSEFRGAAEHCVGGQSKFYGAALYRLRERDFSAVLTEDGESPAWPIAYADIEPFYCEAEHIYGVRGSTDDDPSEPAHSRPYPHGPIEHEAYLRPMLERIRSQGLPVSHIPKAIDFGAGGRCVLCTRCDGHYCQLDAKLDAEIAALRPALATGRVELRTGTTCVRVLTDATGRRATGAVLRHGGDEFRVQAGTIAVSGGVVASPQLLRRSESAAHPHGIGNASGGLGRHLAGHSAGLLFASHGRRLPPLHQKTFAINAFYSGSPGWSYPTGVIQAAGQLPLWQLLPERVAPKLGPLVSSLLERSLMCCLMTEAIPTRESGLEFAPDGSVSLRPPRHRLQTYRRLRRRAIEAFRRAGFRLVVARRSPGALWHAVGTARMGNDPATSVIDPACRVHGMDNLYVVDSSSLPSAGAVNTTLTVIALALRTAAVITGESAPAPVSARGDAGQRAPHAVPLATETQGCAHSPLVSESRVPKGRER